MTVTSQPILGERLRVLRRARGVSLSAVADATDMSISFLSLLESGKTDVTLGRLMRLVQYYGVPVTDLLPQEDDGPTIVRADERQASGRPANGAVVFTVLPPEARGLGAEVVVLEPGSQIGHSRLHDGQTLLYLLEGDIEIDFEKADSAPLTLNAGDSIFFRGNNPRTYRNRGNVTARAVIAHTVPP